jgi:hypothetical protein
MTGSAKQSSFSQSKLDCFAAALLAMTAVALYRGDIAHGFCILLRD